MTPEMVDKHLENYREYSARCSHLEHEIHELRLLAEKLRKTAVSDAVHITSVMTGMPHGTEITDPTGRIAMQFADGYTPDYIVEIDREIRRLDDEYRTKISTVIFVDSWMKALTKRERYVVENKVLGGMYWRDLIAGFKQEFNEVYSKRALQNLRDVAVEHIYKIAE